MHPATLATDLELREDSRHVGVRRGVADVVLAARGVGRREDELLGFHVVRRCGPERLDVGPVPRLGHREAAHQPAGDQVGQVGVVVRLRAELEDRAAEEAELHPDLDQHAQVAEGEGLEGGHRRSDVAATAELAREAHAGLAGTRHLDDDVTHTVAEVGGAHLLGVHEDLLVLGQVAPDERAHVGVLPVEEGRQGRDLDDGLHVAVALVLGRGGLGRHVLESVARGHVPQGSVARVNRPEPEADFGHMAYNFSIVGVQKSGTSTLSGTISQHRLVCRPPRKEAHFFNNEDYD